MVPSEVRAATRSVVVDATLRMALESIYSEIMWLATRPNVTPGRARSWYTHVMSETVKRRLRRFSGKVSVAAVNSGEPLMLEHFKRLQTTLSDLVRRHRQRVKGNVDEFIRTLVDYEQVHIVTRSENYAAMRAKGDYKLAGIRLVTWAKLPAGVRGDLWKRMLNGRVANAAEFKP